MAKSSKAVAKKVRVKTEFSFPAGLEHEVMMVLLDLGMIDSLKEVQEVAEKLFIDFDVEYFWEGYLDPERPRFPAATLYEYLDSGILTLSLE